MWRVRAGEPGQHEHRAGVAGLGAGAGPEGAGARDDAGREAGERHARADAAGGPRVADAVPELERPRPARLRLRGAERPAALVTLARHQRPLQSP